MGGHVGVVCRYTNAPSAHAPGGDLAAVAWLSAEGWAQQPAGDACLTVAGADPNISGGWLDSTAIGRKLAGGTCWLVPTMAPTLTADHRPTPARLQ